MKVLENNAVIYIPSTRRRLPGQALLEVPGTSEMDHNNREG